MQAFTKLNAIAAPLPIDNVDTDMIIPKQFLKTIKRTGLAEGLFYEMRYEVDGTRIDDFVLHQAPYDQAQILIGGDNFGCGSSREHAPWALLDFGIRCVIAKSFADIFYNNCFKNGILPVKLDDNQVDALMKIAQSAEPQLLVDLEAQTITAEAPSDLQSEHIGTVIPFEIDPFRKHCLINGLDDIGLTLEKSEQIDTYEANRQSVTPWLFAGASAR